MPVFLNDGIRFNYEILGNGPPLVMCHGLTGDLNAPKELLGTFPNHRLILLDARAHGNTHPLGPESRLCFAQFAADVQALMSHLKIDHAIVGGISMGAGIATRVAIDFPQKVCGLILIRPAWLDTPNPPNLDLLPLIARLFEMHGPKRWLEFFDEHDLVQHLTRQNPVFIENLRKHFELPFAVERKSRLTRIPGDCPIRSWSEVETLDVPSLTVCCERDSAHPAVFAEIWAAHLRRGEFWRAATKSVDFERHASDVRKHVERFCSSLS